MELTRRLFPFALLVALLLPMVASAQTQRFTIPSPGKMKYACELTKGTWRHLPKRCNNMRPETWRQLTRAQQHECYDLFHEPCDCGTGMRFSIQPVLGCIQSNFQGDHWK